MKNYELRLNEIKKWYSQQNIDVNDLTPLYSDFIYDKKTNRFNYLWKRVRKDFDKQYQKRIKKDNFNKNLFSKIIYNWLYRIKLDKNDLIPWYAKKDSDIYNFYSNHQYVRKELEKLSIKHIMFLAYKLGCTFKRK